MTSYRISAALLLSLALLPVGFALADPTTRPVTAPPTTRTATTRTATTAAVGNRPEGPSARPYVDFSQQRLEGLTSRAISQLENRNYKGARASLTQALRIDPEEPTDLYNLACLDALTRHPDAAVTELRLAAEAGFDDFAHIAIDTDLTSVRGLPEYRELFTHKERYERAAADRAVANLRKQFGADYLYEIDEPDKFIFATNTDQTTLEALKKSLTDQAKSQWAQLFSHKPEGYTTVVVPSMSDYRKIQPDPSIEGFYNPATHTLIASGLGFVTTHEFTHALHFGDLEMMNQNHPTWIVEGMAVLFEQTEYRDGVLTPLPNMRFYELQFYKSEGDLVPFPRLMRLNHPDFMAVAGPGYAESGGIMLYLYDHKLLREFYDAVKADYAKDPTGKMALEQVTGKKLPALQKDWEAWMLKQTPPPLYTGPKGAFMGVEFQDPRTMTENAGVGIRDVIKDGPAAKAGVRPGGRDRRPERRRRPHARGTGPAAGDPQAGRDDQAARPPGQGIPRPPDPPRHPPGRAGPDHPPVPPTNHHPARDHHSADDHAPADDEADHAADAVSIGR